MWGNNIGSCLSRMGTFERVVVFGIIPIVTILFAVLSFGEGLGYPLAVVIGSIASIVFSGLCLLTPDSTSSRQVSV